MKTRSSASSREPVFAGLVFAGLLTLGTTMGVGCQAPASDTRSSRSGGNSTGNTPGIKTYVSGAIALKSGDVKAAEVQLKNAIKENPELRMPHIKLSEIYRQRNDFEQAVPHMEAISKLDPYNQQNMYFLGLGYQLLGRLQDSALAYLRALKLDVVDPKSTVNLGLVYYSLGQIDPSIFYLQRATELDKSNPRAWSNLGVALDGKGDLPQAESAYRRAIELEPKNATTLSNLTNNLLDQNRPEDAAAAALELTERAPSPAAFRVLATTLTRAKKWSQAQAAFDRALTGNPRDFQTLEAMGDMNIARYVDGLELDDALRQQAVEQYRASLTLKPDQPKLAEKLKKYATAGKINKTP